MCSSEQFMRNMMMIIIIDMVITTVIIIITIGIMEQVRCRRGQEARRGIKYSMGWTSLA